MYKVIVNAFGGTNQFQIIEQFDLIPDDHQVIVKLTSIGINYADIMARRGEYKLISGNPPFTPGVEAGGTIAAIGKAVSDRQVGQRVILSIDAPVANGRGAGTYQSHYLTAADRTIPVPEGIADHLLGALWLPFMDVSPLIRKFGAIRGWLLNEIAAHPEAAQQGYQHILEGIATGRYQLRVAGTFALKQVAQAHDVMETGNHIGKFILIPE